MTTQVIVKPQGIITEPNKVGQFPPGAFSYSENCAIRSFGVLEQVRKFGPWSFNAFPGSVVGGVYAVSDGPYTAFIAEHNATGTWRCVVYKVSVTGGVDTTSVAIGSPWSTYLTNDGRTGVAFIRNRIIITGTVRSFAIDVIERPSDGAVFLSGPRDCGLYQTVLYDRSSTLGAADDPAYLAPNEHFSATSVLRQIHADGYELVSPPAVPYDFPNLSSTLPQISSLWTTKADLTSTGPFLLPHEHKIDIYRTRAQSVGYDSVGNKYHPISTGSSLYLSKTFPWEVNYSSYFNRSSDTTLPSTLGEALLTNVSASGASALPLPPTPAKTSCVFRGHAFYANRWDPATLVLLNPYYWGFMDLATASTAVLTQGIGTRVSTGQTSVNGSPTVTGFPSTTGIVPGQSFNAYRVDTGALVTAGNSVLSKTSTTVTGTSNVTYSGAVRTEFFDRIEINGVNFAALESPQAFISQLFYGNSVNKNTTLDVSAVGLEPATANSPVGVYPNFVPTGGLTFRMRTNAPLTIRATNGANFSPALPEISATALQILGKQQKNGYGWSENNEPENCPPSNYAFAGSGEIYKVIATRDCVWFFCSDGLFRLSGSGGSAGDGYDWALDPVDPSLVITNPNCACVHRDYVYAFTNRGFVSISSEGLVRLLSDGRIAPTGIYDWSLQNKAWRTPAGGAAIGVSLSWNWVVADSVNDEIWIRDRPDGGGISTIWVYSVKTDSWTIRLPSIYPSETPTICAYNAAAEAVLMLFGNRPDVITSVGTAGDYEQAVVNLQPVYGPASPLAVAAAYTQKHWQDVSLSFRCPQLSASTTCTLRSQNIIAGTRTIPTAGPTGNQMETARIGFSVPRAWPAMANSIAPELTISSPPVSSSTEPMKLEGISISYLDFTPQRIKR